MGNAAYGGPRRRASPVLFLLRVALLAGDCCRTEIRLVPPAKPGFLLFQAQHTTRPEDFAGECDTHSSPSGG